MGGWVGAVCTFWYERLLVVFSLRQLTCMHCVYLSLSTRKFCAEVFMPHINIFVYSFIHYYVYTPSLLNVQYM